MKIVVKLIPYYWIIQGLLIALSVKGFGILPLIGGISLIICTVIYQKVNAGWIKVLSILYVIYSISFMIMMGVVFLFFGFYLIHILISIFAILNLIFSFIQIKYRNASSV